MSASTKVAGVHACHLTIGDQKTEGWALNRTRHRLHSLSERSAMVGSVTSVRGVGGGLLANFSD